MMTETVEGKFAALQSPEAVKSLPIMSAPALSRTRRNLYGNCAKTMLHTHRKSAI